jgi:hypothetical protein
MGNAAEDIETPQEATETPAPVEGTEAPAVEQPPEPAPLDELERARVEIRRRTSTLKKRERELEQRSQSFAEKEKSLAEVDELRKLKDSDPWEFMQKLGVDPRELVSRSYEKAQKAADPALAKVQELEERLATQEKARLEAEAAAVRAQDLAVVDSTLNGMATDLPALFAFIEDGEYSKADVIEYAYQEIVSHHAKTGVVLDVSEVLTTYDQQLLQAAEKAARRYQRLRPPAPEPTPAPAAPALLGKPKASPTLSNRDVAAKSSERPPTTREELIKDMTEQYRRMTKR